MARFQDTQSSHFRCSEALDPLTWHDVQIHLGTAGFELIVDGVSSNSGSFLWEESMDPFPCDNEEVSTSMRFNTNPWLIGRDNELGTSDTVVAKKTSAGGTLLDHLVIRVRDPVGP